MRPEKAYEHEQKVVLHSLTHRIAEGRGKSRSRSVQHSFPDVTTRSPILSTGNYSGPEMARNVKLKWGEQDQARFISIPVPKAAAGGVVDLAPGEDHARPGSELIQQLEQALRANYGESLRRWVKIAWLRRNKVNSLMDEFVNKVGANSSHDRRIARKFGFVYAAGTIAVNAGFLNWRKSVPFKATRRLFELAMSELDARSPAQHLQALVNALQDLPDCGNRHHVTLKKGQPFIGLKFRREGKRFIGVRAEKLSTIVPGTEAIYALLNALDQAGVLEKGHGGKRAKQVNISVRTGEGETIRKPRLLVMQASKLTDLLKNESS